VSLLEGSERAFQSAILPSAMEFEGLTLEGTEDFYRHIRNRTSTRHWGHLGGEDPFWVWILRFLDAHPERRDWVDDAVVRIAREEGGDAFLLSAPLSSIVRLAQGCGVKGVGKLLEDRLARPRAGWTDEQVRFLLDHLLGFHPTELSEPALVAIVELGTRPGCFPAAFSLLARVDAEQAAEFAADVLAAGDRSADDLEQVLTFVASRYLYDESAPFRQPIVGVVAPVPELRAGFIKALKRGAFDEDDAARAVEAFERLAGELRDSE